MKPAAFEEREYEAPLYNQFVVDDNRVWSPGQVFEGHIGLDYSAYVTDPWLFRLHGHRLTPSGAVLSRYAWPRGWFRRGAPGRLPTFHLNLFIQAKRPEWGRRVPANLRVAGIHKPYWRFSVDPVQQRSLERVAARLGRRALLVYAAPAFHSHADLWRHTTSATVIRNSTFPSIQTLSGHQAWYYCRPGAVGVPNPKFKPTEEPLLSDRIEKLLEQKSDGTWRHELTVLAGNINDSLSDEGNEPSSRVAAFFDLQKQWHVDARLMTEGPELKAYMTLSAFAEIFNLNWLTVGPG